MERKVLFEDPYFDLVELNGMRGVQFKRTSVMIMPYTVDENRLVKEIGILKEYNPFRADGYSDTLITGTIEYEDDSLLYTACRELEEEGGFKLDWQDSAERWIFLGLLSVGKDSDRQYPTFAVDVTGLEQFETVGDGSMKESSSKLVMTPVDQAVSSDESLLLATFLRFFNFFYKQSTQP